MGSFGNLASLGSRMNGKWKLHGERPALASKQCSKKWRISPNMGILKVQWGKTFLGNSPVKSWGILPQGNFILNLIVNDQFLVLKNSNHIHF